MTLDIIKLQTTWNDAAGSINSNYAKIADAIAQLKANGGGGGSGADIDLTAYATKVWVEAQGYITASALTPYLKTEDAEETYATKDFVNNKLVDYAPLTSVQGFENRIGGLEGAVPQLNERVSIVEGKVSTLNEIVSTGENNLLDRVNVIEEEYATKVYVDNAIDRIDLSVYLLKADLTKSRIQSTLGISDWALAATKPSYTAAEVGALSLDGTSKMQQSKNIVWSNTEGYEDIDVFSNGLRLLGYNASKGNYGGGIHIGTRYGWQLMTKYGENPLYYRSYNIGSQIWRDWETLAFASDIPTKLSQLTDDVVAGKYLPLSGGTLNGSITATSFIGNLTGNADSATKLQTPRKLWGQSFDGTDKVSGDINNAAGGIYIHNTNEINSFNGKLYLNHRGSGQTGYGSTNDIVMVANGGNVGIGTTAITEKLDVAGNIKASGNINATSITINGVTITASNGSITVNGNVFATGDITGGV